MPLLLLPFFGLLHGANPVHAALEAPPLLGGFFSSHVQPLCAAAGAKAGPAGLSAAGELGGALVSASRNATQRGAPPAPVDVMLLASALLAGSGRLGAAREALSAAEAAAEGAAAAAAAAPAPPPPLVSSAAASHSTPAMGAAVVRCMLGRSGDG